MNHSTGCFGSFGDPKQISYCQPLQQLINEHPSLLAKIAEFHQMVESFEADTSIVDWNDPLNQLYDKITIFVAELEPHSTREEDVLFEMMANYIGRDGGPIAVMEYEHDTAKLNLKLFIDKVKAINEERKVILKDEALAIFKHLKIVQLTLTDHFMKEESILFPMAEQMLSAEDKQALAKQFARIG